MRPNFRYQAFPVGNLLMLRYLLHSANHIIKVVEMHGRFRVIDDVEEHIGNGATRIGNGMSKRKVFSDASMPIAKKAKLSSRFVKWSSEHCTLASRCQLSAVLPTMWILLILFALPFGFQTPARRMLVYHVVHLFTCVTLLIVLAPCFGFQTLALCRRPLLQVWQIVTSVWCTVYNFVWFLHCLTNFTGFPDMFYKMLGILQDLAQYLRDLGCFFLKRILA